MTEEYTLYNNAGRSRYELHIGQHKPLLEYMLQNDGTIYLTHIEVEPDLKGKGIGSYMIEAVLHDIESKGYRMVPICPFVTNYIRRHSEWNKLFKLNTLCDKLHSAN
jgi:predicted GNAT family acetyltransferase